MSLRKQMIYLSTGLLVLFLAACGTQQNGIPVTGQTPSASQPPLASATFSTSQTPLVSETPSANQTPLASETSSTSQIPSIATAVGSAVPPQVVLAAQQWLALQLGVLAKDVQIGSIEQVEWPDSCLGLGRPNESCAQVATPGWKAVFEVNGNTYEVRTDETGSTIRLATQGGTPSAHAELENIFWNLVSFGPNSTEKPLVQGSRITLLLADGKAGGFGGCNAYGGTYQIMGNQISFSQMTSTLMACADNKVTDQEQQYLQALESAGAYEVNGNSLRITYDKGVLVFEAANQAIPTLPSETATP